MKVETKHSLGDRVYWYKWWTQSDSGNTYGPIQSGIINDIEIKIAPHMFKACEAVVFYNVNCDGEIKNIAERVIIKGESVEYPRCVRCNVQMWDSGHRNNTSPNDPTKCEICGYESPTREEIDRKIRINWNMKQCGY